MFILVIGDESIRASVSVGTSLDQYIGDLALELTDAVTNTPVYYINVVAINGAGMASTSKSSRLDEMIYVNSFVVEFVSKTQLRVSLGTFAHAKIKQDK